MHNLLRSRSSGPPFPCSAFTLMEFILATGVGTSAVGVIVALTIYTARTFQSTGNYAALDQAGRHAVDVMTRDIRQAQTVTSFATNQLVFQDLTNGTFSYTWDSQAATLTRVYNGQSNVMLTGCDYLVFHAWQRTPSNGFTFWPALAATNTKLIDVTWNCSRLILGQKANTESIQTAKIAIRN